MKIPTDLMTTRYEELQSILNVSEINTENKLDYYLNMPKYKDVKIINLRRLTDIKKYNTSKTLYKFVLTKQCRMIEINEPLEISNCILDFNNNSIICNSGDYIMKLNNVFLYNFQSRGENKEQNCLK